MNDDTEQLSDMELVEHAKKDPAYFAPLVQRYEKRLFAFVRHISSFSREDIEDVLQESFIKAYRHLNDVDPNMKFSTWVYQITRNTTIDEFRKKQSRPKSVGLEDYEMVSLFTSSSNIEAEQITKDTMEKLRSSIEALPDKYREVLILKFLENKSYDEIMDIVQAPKGTIAARINRAKKLLIEECKHHSLF